MSEPDTVDVAELRREYSEAALGESDVADDPITQFCSWLAEAVAADAPDPNAMTVATAGADGRPSARTMLLKGVDARGFVFFTNYESRKGRELDANPHAALVFHWGTLERQVVVTGGVRRVSAEESDAYFASRPLGYRVASWASAQSSVIPDRAALERRRVEVEERFAAGAVPRPPYWGGFRLRPDSIEFWQGRPNRLHDRLRYRRDDGVWRIERLSP